MTAVMGRTSARTLIDDTLFERLTRRIVTDEGVSQDMAARIMDQALAFLAAAADNRGAPIAPSPSVDIGWHTFILYTREYSAFCQRVAGRFLHHVPDDEPGASSPGEPTEVRDRTVAAIANAGYVVDHELWGSGRLCSQCHNGCADDPPPNPPPKDPKKR